MLFIRVIAESVAKFVSNCEIEEPFSTHTPLQQQFPLADRYLCNERFLDEGLSFRIERESWTVYSKPSWHEDGLPLL